MEKVYSVFGFPFIVIGYILFFPLIWLWRTCDNPWADTTFQEGVGAIAVNFLWIHLLLWLLGNYLPI